MFNKLKQYKELRDQAKRMQSALAEETITVERGGVKIVINGNMEITSVNINENLAKEFEQAPDSVRISQDDKGKIIFDGRANAGRAIEREKLLKAVNVAIADKKNEVEIPLKIVPPKILFEKKIKLRARRPRNTERIAW